MRNSAFFSSIPSVTGSDPVLARTDNEARREGAAGNEEESVLHTLSTADEIHYFDPVALTNDRVGTSVKDDLQIVLDGDQSRIDGQSGEQLGDVSGCVSSCGSPLTVLNTCIRQHELTAPG